jgi:hypothetical protein
MIAAGELGVDETEAAFLARHGLLSAGERGRLRKGFVKPEALDRACASLPTL